MAEINIDARGSSCPGPITELAKAYRNAHIGDTIIILATDPGIKSDVQAWAERTSNKIESITEDNGIITVKINILKR